MIHLSRTKLTGAIVSMVAVLLVTSCAGSGSSGPPAAPSGDSGPRKVEPTPIIESKPTRPPTDKPDERPNIVLITTDDQTMTDMEWMPQTRHLIGDAGVTFPRSLSPHPLCCPARAEILTGQYAQNNGVRHNTPQMLGGFPRLDPAHTIATWLHAARYQTAFIGKYLNGYTKQDGFEPGWDIWNPTIGGVYRYFEYTMLNNGVHRYYDDLHNVDLLGQQTAEYISSFSEQDEPFFIWASHVAPHSACVPKRGERCWEPALPAERHADLFPDAESPSLSDPAFNEGDVSDKPDDIRETGPADTDEVNDTFRGRIRSLQAVDDAVASTVEALRNAGELDNTFIVFTSDNGYLLGEHTYTGKNVPYEQALRVPLLVRGPGIPGGTERDQVVSTIDLAPTFLDAGDATANRLVDGRSILPILRGADVPGYDTVLIQSGPRDRAELRNGWGYRGVRTDRYTYARYPETGFTELYDRVRDPAEIDNVSGNPDYRKVKAELARRTRQLGHCSGAECRVRFGPLPAVRDRIGLPSDPRG